MLHPTQHTHPPLSRAGCHLYSAFFPVNLICLATAKANAAEAWRSMGTSPPSLCWTLVAHQAAFKRCAGHDGAHLTPPAGRVVRWIPSAQHLHTLTSSLSYFHLPPASSVPSLRLLSPYRRANAPFLLPCPKFSLFLPIFPFSQTR